MQPLRGDLATCPTLFITRDEIQFAVTFAPGTGTGSDSGRTVSEVSVLARSDGGSAAGQVLGDAGVTLGSSARDTEAAYPGGKWLRPAFNPSIERIYVVDQEDGPVTYGFVGDRVAGIVVGNQDIPYEYCG